MEHEPILVTGAGGRVGGVGRTVAEILLRQGLPVRALVHREDERAAELRARGAEVVTADLTLAADVARVLPGCRRVYFGLSVAPYYLEATATMAAVARELGGIEVLVNMSQMTVSQMRLASTTESQQQRQHWLAEQVLDWSGLPVVHLRPTVFLQSFLFLPGAAESIARNGTLRLPFGNGRTSPVDVSDVADVIVAVLTNPSGHIGRVYELTGPQSQTLDELAAEYSQALGRQVRYVDVPYDEWREDVRGRRLPGHLFEHLTTMARLHAQNRYDRQSNDVEKITGHPATRVRDFVARHADDFASPRTRERVRTRKLEHRPLEES
jgi:NAD(P)H dehydrogenase (quinone)